MAKEKKKKGGFGEYYRGIKTEMKKVVWPTKRDGVLHRRGYFDMRCICTGFLVD